MMTVELCYHTILDFHVRRQRCKQRQEGHSLISSFTFHLNIGHTTVP